MKIKKYLSILMALSALLLVSCGNPAVTPTDKNYSVTFKDGETIVKQFIVPEGSKVSDCDDWDLIANYTNSSFAEFHLGGWYSESGTKFTDSSVTEDAVYSAKWQVVVKFHYWSESEKKDVTTDKYYDQNSAIDEGPQIDKSFTKDGNTMTFSYWSTDKTAIASDKATKAYTKTSNSSPVDLYAIYAINSEVKTYTVEFFNTVDNVFKTLEIEEGKTIPENIVSECIDTTKQDFLFWSTSCESFNDAKNAEFAVDTPITSDLKLYGIYIPKILTSKPMELDFENNTIKVYLATDKIFWFKNDYCNLYIDLMITINTETVYIPVNSSTVYFNESNPYLLFNINGELINNLNPGTYVITATNSFESLNSEPLVISEPSIAENVSIVTDDSFAKVTWSINLGTTYTVKAKAGSSIVATKTNCVDSASFYGLDNNTEYTFEITTNGTSDKSTSITGTPSITVKEPDWVVAMYMDGDNNLNDPIFYDMNEVEYGLYKIRKELSEDPKTGYSSVAAVALWDGWAGSSTETPYFSNEGSYLYEFGAEKSTCEERIDGYYGNQVYGDTLADYIIFNNLAISSTTKNLSYTAKDWLLSSSATPANITSNSCGEVNMGSKQTLINYLNWVNAHYKPKKGIILQFSDHGGGPRDAPKYYTLPDGKSLKVENSGRRALCWDENSLSESFLKTKDVSDALNAAGYGTSKKVDMIIMDVCLGASIEDSYQFKDYAKYMVASPNNVPGYGMNYIKMMEAFTSTATIEDIGKQIVKDYAHFYGGYNWDEYAQWMSTDDHQISRYDQLYDREKLELELYQGGVAGITTLSFINLQNIETAVTKLDEVADILINKKDEIIYFTDSSASKLSSEPTKFRLPYIMYARMAALSWPEQFYIDTSLFYKGSFNWLYDISKFADTVMMYSHPQVVGSYADLALLQAAYELKTALNNVIVSSWRDTKLTLDSNGNFVPGTGYENYGFYALLDGVKTTDFTGHSYGLNVAGYGLEKNPETGKLVVPGPIFQFYLNDLDFGKDTDWINLLWYMEYYWDTNN